MEYPNNPNACNNCLHKTSNGGNNLVCLVTGKAVTPGDSCENFVQSKRDSQEILQFGYEAEKEYFIAKLYKLFAFYLVGFILGTIFMVMGYRDPGEHVAIIIIGALLILASATMSIVLLYNLWKFVIGELKKHGIKSSVETPGRAVGFLFIPFFNFYWAFLSLGNLPVDMNRLAVARTGKKAMPNEIGFVLCITTILSIIPIIGVFLALLNVVLISVYYLTAINGVKNIPYFSEQQYIQEQPAEPLNMDTVNDFSQLFNKKYYGVNYMFGLYVFIAIFCVQVVATIVHFYALHISILSNFSAIVIRATIFPVLYALVWLILSHAVRNKIVLALLVGLTNAFIYLVPLFFYVLFDGYETNVIFNKGILIQLVDSFTSAVLIIICVSAFIRLYGLKLWSIMGALALAKIVNVAFSFMLFYFMGEKFEFVTRLYFIYAAHILFLSLAVYFAFYQYVEKTQKLSRENSRA